MNIKSIFFLVFLSFVAHLQGAKNTLHDAVYKNDLGGIQKLLETKTINVNAVDESGLHPFHFVKTAEAADILRSFGGLIDTKHKNTGKTPLHAVAYAGNISAVEFLIFYKADVNAKDKDERTPLHFAVIGECRYEKVCCLLQHGANVNVKDKDKRTPLHTAISAAEFKQDPIVEEAAYQVVLLLLQKGADVTVEDINGARPIDLATNPRIKMLLAAWKK
jgi:ankyrin repeat protein